MSIASGVFTLAEIDAQIANIKEQLMSPNAGYSINPADGGAGRSVQRNDRDALNAELTLWMRRRAALTGARRGRLRTKRVTFARWGC